MQNGFHLNRIVAMAIGLFQNFMISLKMELQIGTITTESIYSVISTILQPK